MTLAAGPGWYQDPYHPSLVSYWDGTTWTGQTQPSMPAGVGVAERDRLKAEVGHLVGEVARLRAGYDMLRRHVVETNERMILQEVGIGERRQQADAA